MAVTSPVVIFVLVTAGTPGQGDIVRRYWDAYNYATLFVVLLIIFGGVWNWIAGARSRRQGLDEV